MNNSPFASGPVAGIADLPAASAWLTSASQDDLLAFLCANCFDRSKIELVRLFSPGLSETELMRREADKLIDTEKRRRANLIAHDAWVLEARFGVNAYGDEYAILTLASWEFPCAIGGSAPQGVRPGAKVRLRGQRGEYKGEAQIDYGEGGLTILDEEPRDPGELRAEFTAEGVRQGRLLEIVVTLTRRFGRNPNFIAGSISAPRPYERFGKLAGSASVATGPISEGDRLLVRGVETAFDGKPQFKAFFIEPLPPDFGDGGRLAYQGAGGSKEVFETLHAQLGVDFPEKILERPERLKELFPRKRQATLDRELTACRQMVARPSDDKVFRSCGVPSKTVEAIRQRFPRGLLHHSAYEMVDVAPIDEDAPRGAKKGLTPLQADRVEQTAFVSEVCGRCYDRDNLPRAAAYVEEFLMQRCNLRGDCGAPLDALLADLTVRLAVCDERARQALAMLAGRRRILLKVGDETRVWIGRHVLREMQIADSVLRRLEFSGVASDAPQQRASKEAHKPRLSIKRARVAREVIIYPDLAKRQTVVLTEEQRAAAKLCLERRFSLLKGPPGAGKTVTLAAIVDGCARPLIATVAAAAARRAAEVTGCEAVTVHALTHDPRTQELRPQSNALRRRDALIIDEASMVSASQLAMLLHAADKAGVARIVLCGDSVQLQPIGSGAPFFDLIASGVVPTATLSTIHRSQSGSGVQALVSGVRAGEFDGKRDARTRFAASDAEFVQCDAAGFVDAICAKRIELVSTFGTSEVIGLSPFNNDEFGIDALNARSREIDGCDPRAPVAGEALLCVKNAPRPEDRTGYRLLNGTRLIVDDTVGDHMLARPLDAEFNLRLPIKPHARGPAESINWGRFATVHKFQGSEAQAALVVIPPGALKIIEGEPFLFELASFYTAVSRAKRHIVVMGALEQLPALIRNGSRRRITSLERLLWGAKS